MADTWEGLPKSARETLSAFSNTDGETMLLGVNETNGFATIDLKNPVALHDGMVRMPRDDHTPSAHLRHPEPLPQTPHAEVP